MPGPSRRYTLGYKLCSDLQKGGGAGVTAEANVPLPIQDPSCSELGNVGPVGTEVALG